MANRTKIVVEECLAPPTAVIVAKLKERLSGGNVQADTIVEVESRPTPAGTNPRLRARLKVASVEVAKLIAADEELDVAAYVVLTSLHLQKRGAGTTDLTAGMLLIAVKTRLGLETGLINVAHTSQKADEQVARLVEKEAAGLMTATQKPPSSTVELLESLQDEEVVSFLLEALVEAVQAAVDTSHASPPQKM